MSMTCANPQCGAPFYRFGGGRLRAIPVTSSGSMMFLWLCDDCLGDEVALGFEGDDDDCTMLLPQAYARC
jgi:hypothetical protein